MRKKDETIRKTILTIAKQIANSTGIDSINIRDIATKAGIATGTVYNYFSDKDDILLALTQEYWQNVLKNIPLISNNHLFYKDIEAIYLYLYQEISQSAGALMHSLNNAKQDTNHKMKSMQESLVKLILERIEKDTSIPDTTWHENFTKEQYAHFIVSNMVSQLQNRASNIDFFIEIVKKTLY